MGVRYAPTVGQQVSQKEIEMAKTEEDLRQSRENRERIIKQLGCVPESILLHEKGDRAIDLITSERSYASTQGKFKGVGHMANCDAFTMSGPNCRLENGALSKFPQNIGRLLVKFYTIKGDTVVDPFAGHNSRMELCWRSGRNYIGQDLSAEFMVANRTIREMLLKEVREDMIPETHSQASIELHEGDSKRMAAKDESGDFTITSPPYWDIEFYGQEPEQLGYGKSYDQFLEGLSQVAKENYRALKPDAFCVWCVNDFRKDGQFFDYHGDTIKLMKAAGFTQWDVAITDLGSSFGAAFAQQVVERRILPKRHEYCLVFRKIVSVAKPKRVKAVKAPEVAQLKAVSPTEQVEPQSVEVVNQKYTGNWWSK